MQPTDWSGRTMVPTFEESLGPVDSACPTCGGEGWVCENHPNEPWGEGDGCCGGAGMPCPTCRRKDGPRS